MKSRFLILLFVFSLASQVFSLDFGEQPLNPEVQAQLDTLIEKLGETSHIKREKTIGEIVKFGDGALDTLYKAENHKDLTIAERAKYCVSLIAPGLSRSKDSSEVQRLLREYSTSEPVWKMLVLLELSQLPEEESLVPLVRVAIHEKSALPACFAALGVLRRLPFTQPLPEFSIPVPEAKVFPDPDEWNERNERNRKLRQEKLAELSEYLALEPGESEGKRFLVQLLELEKSSRAENSDAAPFGEIFQKLYDEMETEDINVLTFLHEFLYFSLDTLIQNGHEKAAKDFFLRQTAMGLTGLDKAEVGKDYTQKLNINYRALLIYHLVLRGHWNFVVPEIARLRRGMSSNDKCLFHGMFCTSLSTIGEFRLAWEYTREIQRLAFMDQDGGEEEDRQKFRQQLFWFRALDACKQKDYVKAREVLKNSFQAEGEPDVDSLILARKIAVFTNDSIWQGELEKRIDSLLDETTKGIQAIGKPDLNFDKNLVNIKAGKQNTFAWLAANTGRRLEEAQMYAEEAVSLLPENMGIRDTLAFVHFARGEHKKAFEVQSEATRKGFTELELWVNLERMRAYKNEESSESSEKP